jgi:hypothetical protein
MLQLTTLLSAFTIIVQVVLAQGVPYVDYDNDFINPTTFLAKNFNSSTEGAQQSIVAWANYLAAQGPWSVLNKTILAPTGNIHDYLSWAPYYWPNCSNVHNTTQLQPEQMWAQCNYEYRDGQFNPDRLLVNDTGHFQAMSDAVFYNTLAWVITGSTNYSSAAVSFLDTWFINPASAMTPNLQYAQMQRGPTGQIGTHTGLLDFKQMAKIASAIMILREGNNTYWTETLNTQMMNWTTNYLEWMTTSPIAYQEWVFPNNHGTFFYNQLSALQILVGDTTAAINSTKSYFAKQYQSQIDASGEQPYESVRTHPYHYRCYNLAAMITNAKIGEYLGITEWNTTTSQGATIRAAADFTMLQTPTAEGDGPPSELYPSIAAVGAAYGDPDGKYAAFLANADDTYPAQPYFLFNQPFSDSNLAAANPPSSGNTNSKHNGVLGKTNGSSLGMTGWVFVVLSIFLYN